MSTAALVAGFQQRAGRRGSFATWTAAPTPPTAVPTGPMVEIFYDEAWHDITSYVFYESRISITRGRPDESSQTNPASLSLVINNRNGYFSPRNPVSPLYGKIGRNTPIRVSKWVNGSQFFRFSGEVVAWPQTWDLTGQDIRVPITASGIKRRLNHGNSPLNSVMYRAITSIVTELNVTETAYIPPQYRAYWPCEDVSGSTVIASGFSGNAAMTISGTPNLATDSSFVASSPLPTMGTASFTGKVPTYSATSSILVRFFLKIPSTGATNGQTICTVSTTGDAANWKLTYGTGGALRLQAFDSAGTSLADSGNQFAIDGVPLRMSIEITQNGSNVQGRMAPLQVGASTGSISDISVSSATVGRATSITMAADKGLTDTVIGHVSVQSANTSIFGLASQINAYLGENPDDRYTRLCSEQGITKETSAHFVGHGNLVTMGYQATETLTNLLQQIIDTDMGIDFEPKDQLGLTYRFRSSFYNQAAQLTLDYNANDLAEPLTPSDDDQRSLNDLTVIRDGGSSARAEVDEGPLSVLDPPDGVGRYDDSKTLSLGSDDQCDDQAGWRVFLGTVDEPRYPSVTIQLAHPAFTGSYALTSAALALEIGDRIDVLNPPFPSAPDDISLLVQGWTETFDQFLHEISYTCTPYSPWNVAFFNDATYSLIDTDDSSLHQDYNDPTTTTLLVDVNSGALWTTDAPDFPFDIKVAGEVMTVTSISGSSSPQTFTVTRSVNGVSKAQYAGTDVRLLHPAIIGL